MKKKKEIENNDENKYAIHRVDAGIVMQYISKEYAKTKPKISDVMKITKFIRDNDKLLKLGKLDPEIDLRSQISKFNYDTKTEATVISFLTGLSDYIDRENAKSDDVRHDAKE